MEFLVFIYRLFIAFLKDAKENLKERLELENKILLEGKTFIEADKEFYGGRK